MTDLAADLRQFNGSENWHRHGLCRNIIYTDGVKYLAETANAFWLIDKIATNQMDPKIRANEFQCWKLKLDGTRATLTCDDGDENVLHTEEITFTDFPLPEIDLWVEGSTILLPSEH